MLDSIMLIVAGSMLCISVNSFIMGLGEVVLGRVCGFDILYFKYMFFDLRTVSYINNEKKISFGKFSAICQHMIWQPDVSKRDDKKERRFTWIHLVFDTVIEIILIMLMFCVVSSFKQTGNVIGLDFFRGVLYTLIFFTISRLVTEIRIMVTLDKHLATYRRNEIRKMVDGMPLEELSLPPYKELSLISPDYEIIPYESTRFMQKVWMEKYDELEPIVEEIEKHIRKSESPSGYLKTFTNAYYNLIFYYSFFKTDNKKSKYYYNAVSKDLENDIDTNGRRVLAYYYYFVYNDESKARELIDAAWKVLPQFSICQGERDYEAKLLKLLTEKMDRKEC